MKNILVAINFDKNDQLLLDKAFELANPFNAKLWLVHIAAPEHDFVGYEVGPQHIRDIRAEELRKEHKLIQKLANTLEKKGVTTEALLIHGATVEMIIEEAKKLHADMVIVGRSKRNFFYKTFVGSISKGIIKKSTIPVLIVPQ